MDVLYYMHELRNQQVAEKEELLKNNTMKKVVDKSFRPVIIDYVELIVAQ
jgi:hypothetical protein